MSYAEFEWSCCSEKITRGLGGQPSLMHQTFENGGKSTSLKLLVFSITSCYTRNFTDEREKNDPGIHHSNPSENKYKLCKENFFCLARY